MSKIWSLKDIHFDKIIKEVMKIMSFMTDTFMITHEYGKCLSTFSKTTQKVKKMWSFKDRYFKRPLTKYKDVAFVYKTTYKSKKIVGFFCIRKAF